VPHPGQQGADDASPARPPPDSDDVSKLAHAAERMTEVADRVAGLRERVSTLVPSAADRPGPSGTRPQTVAEELVEVAAALEAGARHLMRALELGTRDGIDSQIEPRHSTQEDVPGDAPRLPEGMRVLIHELLAEGWSRGEVARHLSSELDVADAPALITQALRWRQEGRAPPDRLAP
jgi:hypothetical protein